MGEGKNTFWYDIWYNTVWYTIWLRPFFSEFKLLFRLWVENIFVPVHPTKACGGKRGTAALLLRRGAGWRWVTVFIPRPLVPGKEHALATACKARWTLGPVWTCERSDKSLIAVGKSKQVPQHSHYINWATATPSLPTVGRVGCCSKCKSLQLDDRNFRFPSAWYFSLLQNIQTPWGPRSLLSNKSKSSFLKVNWPNRVAHHLLSFSAEDKNKWIRTSTLLHISITQRILEHFN